jgi:uncharacterized protein with von Willebrand factor type A (vWA) domain
MVANPGQKSGSCLMFNNFIYLLREYGVPVSTQYLIEFYDGLEKGMVNDLDDLFLFSRLIFVKHVEHIDAFQRAFSLYFFDIDIPKVAEGDMELFNTKQFRDWLKKAVEKGVIPAKYWTLSREELMKKFWDTVREQMEAHHGGNKWVGTGGTSPFGHSGAAQPGIRVHGQSMNRSAIKIIGDRNYIDYAETNTLKGENIRQALATLKHLKPTGPYSELNLDETIRKTAKNGGEIELIFERDKKDKIEVVLLLDNGGSSMTPYVELTQLLFSKLTDRFKECTTYFFHNTIYNNIYKDSRRYEPLPTIKLFERNPETRIIFVGDASMAPDELMYSYGSIYYGQEDDLPSIVWLKKIKDKFKHTIWLNPINKEEWSDSYGSFTLNKIRDLIHMEDLTLQGIKKAVEFLNRKN